ncbi:reverse transcriptase domain-containing protein [Tanacetum coccineum]
MTDSQSPEEGVRRVLPELRVSKPHSWSIASFPPYDGRPSTTLASQKRNTSRTINMKLNKRPRLKKPYPLSLPEQIFASATQQMLQIRKKKPSDSEGTTSIGREESQGQTNKEGDPEGTTQPPPSPPRKDTRTDEKIERKDEHPKGLLKNKPLEKSIAPNRRKVVKEEVAEWLKAGIVRKVRYPTWVANPVLVKKPDGSWMMCIDFKDLNKACPKDLYPLPEIDWKIKSLMGFKYKCFLDAYKGYHQIQMTKKDEEKTTFHTDEGVFYYTKMPFGLKNPGATYQRLVDTVFKGQMGMNLEAYVDDKVIKSKTEPEIIKDIEETLLTLKMVITNKPISQILNNREATGRLAKWGIELKAYGIKYASRSAIKGQVLADFLADTMAEDSSTQIKASGLSYTLAEGKSREEQEAPEAKAPENLGTEANIWKLYIDGASNEHGSGAYPKGSEYSYALQLNFANSNNDAEYEALLAGLRIAAKMKVEKIHAFVDSKLVASQVEGSYEAKGEKTKKYKEKALEMIRSFNNFQISHIPREDNKKADALNKLAAVQCEGLTKGVLIEELNERSIDKA